MDMTNIVGIDKTRVLSREEWEELGDKLSNQTKNLMWMIGDWLLMGESSGYVERGKLKSACERFGIAYSTAANAKMVSKAFESSLRREHLDWHHHKEVANRDDAQELLEWAAEENASVAKLRQEKKRRDLVTDMESPLPPLPQRVVPVLDETQPQDVEQFNELALFAGAGGGILGGKLLGWRTICAVEQNKYAAAVLMQRQNDGFLQPFPIWDDVRTFDGTSWRGRVDVVSGGFPCQDISVNGTGTGIEGERSGLWGHMARIIREVQPRYAFMENSPALTGRGLHRVLGDLAEMGFDAEWGCISAGQLGAHHERERIWILAANAALSRREENVQSGDGQEVSMPRRDSSVWRPKRWERDRSDVERTTDGVANRMERLTAIGNGQVPAVAATAFHILRGRLTEQINGACGPAQDRESARS